MATRLDALKPEMLRDGSWKYPVRVATTAAGTLASSFENGDTVDGVALATGDRILIKDQATGSQNGIYVVAASGSPARAYDMDTGLETKGSIVYVVAGTANGGKLFRNTNTGTVTVGSTALTFAEVTPSSSPPSGAAGGDLSGTYPNPTVSKVEGVDVTDAGTTGDVLTKTGALAATWSTPAAPTAAQIAAHGAVGEILISDTPSTPLVFADLIQNEAQTDLVYADLT